MYTVQLLLGSVFPCLGKSHLDWWGWKSRPEIDMDHDKSKQYQDMIWYDMIWYDNFFWNLVTLKWGLMGRSAYISAHSEELFRSCPMSASSIRVVVLVSR
jgi:hypothetical protein